MKTKFGCQENPAFIRNENHLSKYLLPLLSSHDIDSKGVSNGTNRRLAERAPPEHPRPSPALGLGLIFSCVSPVVSSRHPSAFWSDITIRVHPLNNRLMEELTINNTLVFKFRYTKRLRVDLSGLGPIKEKPTVAVVNSCIQNLEMLYRIYLGSSATIEGPYGAFGVLRLESRQRRKRPASAYAIPSRRHSLAPRRFCGSFI